MPEAAIHADEASRNAPRTRFGPVLSARHAAVQRAGGMTDPQTAEENLLKWALGGVAGFAAVVVGWILRRESIREDRDYEARRDFTEPLSQLPAKLEALIDRVDRLERRLDEDEP